MKIIKNITNSYRKIASGIAIVAFLTLMYFALIPGGTAALSYVTTASGDPIIGAIVKLVDYPQYNATTSGVSGHEGEYSINNVPYDAISGGSTYTIRTRATGYALNTTTVFINGPSATKNIVLTPGYKITAPGQIYGGPWRTNFLVGNLGPQSTTLDVNSIDLSGITRNNSEDVISSMASKDYNWFERVGAIEGSATITSEQLIDAVTLQRSSSQGKIGFFEGTPLNIEKTQWFMPGMIFSGQWRSGFKTLNLGTIDADVTMYFYNSTGVLINTITRTIPPNTAPYIDWYTYGLVASGNSPQAAEGTVTIVSNNAQPLSVTASQASETAGKFGFWNGIYLNDQKTDVFVTGQLWNNPAWRSGFKVANIGSVDADVTMYFYNSAGTLINTVNRIVSPKASPYFDWYTYGFAPSGNVASDGTVRVVSNNGTPIYVVESQASEVPGFIDFYQGVEINGNNTAGLISLKFGGGERSGFKIANPGNSPITATIKFYNATGVLLRTETGFSVPAKGSPYLAWNSYTTEPSGSVTVEATGRISVTVSFASDTESKMGMFKGIAVQ